MVCRGPISLLAVANNKLPSQWQDAYDKLGEYVWKEEPSTLTYYFGIPYDYEKDFENTPLMFAFEVYNDRKVVTLSSETFSSYQYVHIC